jgi:hypothetical protein
MSFASTGSLTMDVLEPETDNVPILVDRQQHSTQYGEAKTDNGSIGWKRPESWMHTLEVAFGWLRRWG